ncbi:hypothetical protein RGAI101_3323 [Roseobacter sp. GAI101]|nr:hypothetical protein RGAI101_3323 [Roseobacter sp. GAI101]
MMFNGSRKPQIHWGSLLNFAHGRKINFQAKTIRTLKFP